MIGAQSRMVVRRLKSWIFFAFLFSAFHDDAAAGIGTWKNHTDMKSVRAVASDSGTVWGATSGGVFRFNPSDSTYQKFTNSDGLTTNNVTSILIDQTGRVWIGHFSGAVDVYDPSNDSWMYITDIALTAKTDKSIRGFYEHGDALYIATAFGIAVFSLSKFEFIDTYANFATASQPVVHSIVVFQNKVAAATSRGIVVSKPGAVNLAAPESWDIFPSIITGNSLSVWNNELYAGTNSGLVKFQNTSWTPALGIANSSRIIASTDTSILFFASNMLRSVTAGGIVSNMTASFADSCVGGVVTADKKIFLGFNQNGIGTFNTSVQLWETFFPNGPFSNLFYSIVVDENNVVWTASGGAGGNGNGKGFYSYDGSTWKNYNKSNTPLLQATDCFAISIGPDNSKWIGTWGQGLMLVDKHGTVTRRFDNVDPGFVGISAGTYYTVPGAVAVDRSGSVWTTIYQSALSSKVLWKMNPDSAWESFPGSPFGTSAAFMLNVFIDNNNTKWFANASPGRAVGSVPFVYFNENKSLPGTSNANGWGTITESDGMTSTVVYSIVQDRSGDLWLGTSNGITIITNVGDPLNRISKVFLGAVRDLPINCIAIDALNNKWVATSQGVFILSPDGTQLIEQFNVENTNGKLVDNNVFSVAFDKKRGIAYFGTEKGLSSLEIVSIATQSVISSIDLSPNPVYLPDQQQVEIRGLVDESTIKVLSLNGKVLRQFPAQGGGRAFWDCKDGEGNRVASGIYIIVAHDRTGSQVATAKIAVIRK